MKMPVAQYNYGLNERDMHTISNILSNYKEVQRVLIFGSRAKGNYHTGSDIDMAIMGNSLYYKTLRKIKNDFSDSSLPYKVDVINFETISNEDLKNHILRVGKPIYSVETTKLPY